MDQEIVDRVEREAREWHTARLHNAKHHNWLEPDECPTCLDEADAENQE